MALKMTSVSTALSYLSGRSVRPGARKEDLLLRQLYSTSQNLHWKDLTGHYGCVNAIEFSNGLGNYIASGGDDRRVLLWNIEKALSDIGKPVMMKGEHNSNIFCVAFDIHNKTAFSGGNDEQVIVHDLATGDTKDVFSHDDAVYGLSPDPSNPNMFASACDDGKVLIFDVRDSSGDPFVLANYTSSMHSVMYNPVEPRLIATANAKEGVGLWDVRKPRSCLLRYGGSLVQQSCMSVRFNQRGDHIVALRRRLPPVLYNIASHQPVCEFDHSGYYNSCTMKSICFAGDSDQYVLSGSDEFNLYMWALPDDLSERSYINSAHMVLKGHRSIVNQVRFNPANHLIISSGVEKIIKVWSPFKLPEKQQKDEKSRQRRVFTHEEYINLVLQDGSVMSHDYSHESTEEDPRMMAFFDSLVQRELDGWSSDDSMSSNEEALYSRIVQLSQSDIDSDDSLPDLGQNNDDDPAYSPFTIAFASVMASQAADGNESFPRLNRALENAERLYAELNDDQEGGPSSEETIMQSRDLENLDTEPAEGSTSQRDLTALIKRKKKELKESMKRRMKYPLAEIFASDSDESNDVDDSDHSVSNLNIVIDNSSKANQHEKAKSLVENTEDDQRVKKSKEAQIKLQRLKNLRKRVMDSDSDASDIEIHEKKLDSETLEGSASSKLKTEGEFEKVQFKKFKRRNTCSLQKSKTADTERKEVLKARESPDLGPFLQKAACSSSVEVRRTSVEEENKLRTGKLPSDSFSYKGKHKLKSSNRHSHRDDNDKCESKYSFSSEHSHSSNDSKSKLENHSSHHKYSRHFRDRKSDQRDRKTGDSHSHHDSDKDRRDGRKDSHRHERKHQHHYTGENYDKDGRSSRHTPDDREQGHKNDRGDNSYSHDEKRNGYKDGRMGNSDRHIYEQNSSHGKDSKHDKHLKRHGLEKTDGKADRKQRKKAVSDSDATLDLEERRFKFYTDRKQDDSQHSKESNENNRKKRGTKEVFENSRKNRSDEKKSMCSNEVEGTSKRQKFDIGGEDMLLADVSKKDSLKMDGPCVQMFGKKGIGSNDKDVLDKELQMSSQYCKQCAKSSVDVEIHCDKDRKSDGQVCKNCKCSIKGKVNTSENKTLKTEKCNELPEKRTETVKMGENETKHEKLRKVQTMDDQEPSCSYRLEKNQTKKNDDGDDDRRGGHMKCTETERKVGLEKRDSSDSETNDSCNDGANYNHEQRQKVRESSSTEDDQLTWLEFKRFKNRLERARKRYTTEKHHRRNERRSSDDK